MGQTLGDIRARFAAAAALRESKLPAWQQDMMATYSTFKSNGRWIAPKTGEIVRAEFDLDNPEEDIEKFLALSGIAPDEYSIETGNFSGKFDSWGITLNTDKDFFGKILKKGQTWGIINAVDFSAGTAQIIGDKDLTPDKLGLAGNYASQEAIVMAAKEAIRSNVSQPDYVNFCNELIDASTKHNQVFKTVDDIEGIKQEYTINHDLSQYTDLIDAKSVRAIEKDFGEILGGIFMFSIVGEDGTGLTFPKESNLEMVDFFFNGLAVSSKAGKGAKASASGYIAAINRTMKDAKWVPTPEENETIEKVLKPLSEPAKEPRNTKFLSRSRSSSTFSNTVNLFNIHLGSGSAWQYWLSATGMPAGNLNRDGVIQSFITLKENGNLHKTLSKFLSMVGISSSGGKLGSFVNALIKSKNEANSAEALDVILEKELYDILIGIILYGCSKELQKEINSKYQASLTSIINKSTTVKQLYLNFKVKSNLIKFGIKSMENSEFVIGSLNGIDSWGIKSITIYIP